MPGAPKPIMGRCLCGSVTYSADAEPVVQAVDHGEETQPHFEHAARMERGPQ
jgi:hypothetical protein